MKNKILSILILIASNPLVFSGPTGGPPSLALAQNVNQVVEAAAPVATQVVSYALNPMAAIGDLAVAIDPDSPHAQKAQEVFYGINDVAREIGGTYVKYKTGGLLDPYDYV